MNTNHEISLQSAIDMTTLYRAHRPTNFPICETFDKAAIDKLLAEDGCASLRVYYGMDEEMLVHAILVAADAEGADILPAVSSANASGDEDPVILEDALRCPQDCPPPSPLN